MAGGGDWFGRVSGQIPGPDLGVSDGQHHPPSYDMILNLGLDLCFDRSFPLPLCWEWNGGFLAGVERGLEPMEPR